MFFGRKKQVEITNDLDMSNIPKHIGIIMDGNGRWAESRGLPRKAGHRRGAKTIENITDYCATIGVEVVTAYAFSTENWSRPQDEVDALMNLLCDYLSQAEEKFASKRIRLVVSGDMSRFDDRVRTALEKAVELTKSGDRIILNLALNYGGRDEIIRATRGICKDVLEGALDECEINESRFSRYLDTNGMPEVDLIIRPSGEQRLSNFLLWQAAYAEFWFSDICWPDFTADDMKRAIVDFQKRNRRYGGV